MMRSNCEFSALYCSLVQLTFVESHLSFLMIDEDSLKLCSWSVIVLRIRIPDWGQPKKIWDLKIKRAYPFCRRPDGFYLSLWSPLSRTVGQFIPQIFFVVKIFLPFLSWNPPPVSGSGIWIRIDLKCWIRIRVDLNSDPKHWFEPVLRIRIRIGSGFNQVLGSGSRGKKVRKKNCFT